jgi:hypothetical protein
MKEGFGCYGCLVVFVFVVFTVIYNPKYPAHIQQ